LARAPRIPAKRLAPEALFALAHPLRVRILELLREGPSTATQLGRELGESSGATSYHLRALAKVGLVEEDAERGNARDRWWRRPEPLVMVSSADDRPESQAALASLRGVFLQRDEDALAHFLARKETDPEWRDVEYLGNWTVYATPDEISELVSEVIQLVDALRRPAAERPDGADRALISLRALPQRKP
jgi:DNA-binding transcriptional ArsR family regulator